MKHFFCVLLACFMLCAMANIILAEIDAEYDKALTYYNSGKYKEAIELFKNYVQTKPDPSAYYRIGYALYKLGKFDGAEEYFKMTYLIDPAFSPVQHGLPEFPEMTLKNPAVPIPSMPEEVPSKQTPSESRQPFLKPEPLLEKQSPQETQPQMTPAPMVTSPEKSPLPPEPQMIEPKGMIQPPIGLQPFPGSGRDMQGLPQGVPVGLLAGLGIMMYLLAFALYIFMSLCIFLIAKKLDVPAPWTAWIPLVQVWTIVASAGKPWWWILLLLVPIVNAVISIYLWICITENLGKNKWLGLLMLLPFINVVFLGILAFSKTEQPSYTGIRTTPA